MAKINVIGDVAVITSAIKAEDIVLVSKYQPKALMLKDEDGNVEFAIGFVEGCGGISKYGITFGGVARDGSGCATLTLDFDGSSKPEEIKEQLADEIGIALTNLNKIEAGLPNVIEDIAAQKAKVVGAISIA